MELLMLPHQLVLSLEAICLIDVLSFGDKIVNSSVLDVSFYYWFKLLLIVRALFTLVVLMNF